jgi:hypothetical protein
MTSDRDDHHLRIMIEKMEREGRSEKEIEQAVKDATRRVPVREQQPLRKTLQLGRWRLEVARL